MWWSRRALFAQSAICLLISGLIVSLTLAGCGFQPLYGDRERATSVPMQFAQIEIAPIVGRTGLKLENYLKDRFSARGGHYRKAYRLDIALSDSKEGLAIQQDESITRFNYRLLGSARLIRIEDQQILFEQALRTTSAYNVVKSEFATLSAEKDAEDRAARDMSAEILTRLAIYFNKAGDNPAN